MMARRVRAVPLMRRGLRRLGAMVELILHLGAHRTGTTSLQTYLARHRPALAAAGVELWLPDRLRGGLAAGIIHRPADATPDMDARAARSRGLMAVELDRLAGAGRRAVLMTEENLIGSVRTNLREALLYPDLADRLARLGRPFMARVGRVALAVRGYDGFWASSLAFAAVQGFRAPDAALVDRLAAQPRRWRDIVDELADLFPRAEIAVWPAERLMPDPGAQLALLTGGITITGPAGPARRHNASPPAGALAAMLAARGAHAAAALIGTGSGPWQPFGPDARAAMAREYRADLASVAGRAADRIRLLAPFEPAPGAASTRAAGGYPPRSASAEGGPLHGQQGHVA